jgi:hypothetical protein
MNCEIEEQQVNEARKEYERCRKMAAEDPSLENAKWLEDAYQNLRIAEGNLAKCTANPL